jgi:hypothetical protein
MSPELILFNPSKSGIRELNPAKIPTTLPKVTINSLLYKNGHSVLTIDSGNFFTRMYMQPQSGGNQHSKKISICNQPAIEIFNRKLDTNDKATLKLCKTAQSAGKRWGKLFPQIVWAEAPVPTIPISSFDRLAQKSFDIN